MSLPAGFNHTLYNSTSQVLGYSCETCGALVHPEMTAVHLASHGQSFIDPDKEREANESARRQGLIP